MVFPRYEDFPVYSMTPFTVLDFPDHTACVLWFWGCNYRCKYCHNPALVTGEKLSLQEEVLWNFLSKRKGLLDGIVFSGGECTLFPKLPEFIQDVRAMGFKVKLDTNGSNPDMVELLLGAGVLDYVALDYKAPAEKYRTVTGVEGFPSMRKTLGLLCAAEVPFEVRTTVHTDLLNEGDISEIIKDLGEANFRGEYFVQNFRDAETISELPGQRRTLDLSTLEKPKGFSVRDRNF